MGLTDVTFVRAEKLGFGPEARDAAIAAATASLKATAGAFARGRVTRALRRRRPIAGGRDLGADLHRRHRLLAGQELGGLAGGEAAAGGDRHRRAGGGDVVGRLDDHHDVVLAEGEEEITHRRADGSRQLSAAALRSEGLAIIALKDSGV